jgi:ferredoxin-NADP reductase
LERLRVDWRVATVTGVVDETPSARTLVLDIDGWPGHRAGQHADVRLTAEDGYQTERSYSIASPPEDPAISLTIERIDDGEVSPYLAGDVRDGDQFELRGPIGGHFTWRAEQGGPLLLVGGGSGLVPLMAMLRHRAAARSDARTVLLVSSRTEEDILYRAELDRLRSEGDGLAVHHTLTRGAPEGWGGFERRVDAAMLTEVGPPVADAPRIFVCGPTPFVEAVADLLVGMGHAPASIHAERFGPTGG